MVEITKHIRFSKFSYIRGEGDGTIYIKVVTRATKEEAEREFWDMVESNDITVQD